MSTADRADLLAALEGETVHRLTTARNADLPAMLTELVSACPPPLHRWFADQRWQVLALAVEWSARGELAADAQAWLDRLAGLQQAEALAMISGKTPRAGRTCADFDDSALARIGGTSALSGLERHETTLAWPVLVRRLRHAGQSRHALDALRRVAVTVQRSSLDDGPGAALASGLDEIAGCLTAAAGAGGLGDALTAALDEAERQAVACAAGEAPRATWGLDALDDAVPMRPGGLYVLAGAPGGGKTSLALQAVLATAETGRPGAVALISEEMPASQLAILMAARSLGISSRAIASRDPRVTEQEWASLRDLAEGWRKRGTVSIKDSGTAARSTIGSAIAWMRQRSQVAAGNLALVVVDHIGLLDSDDPRADEYRRVTDTTRALKRLAVQLNVPVLALCQMNRAGRREIKDRLGKVAANPEPVLADLRGSGSIEQDADAVIMLHRPEVTTDSTRVPVMAYVRKNRSGPVGAVSLAFRPAFQVFEPIEPEDESAPVARLQRNAGKAQASEDAFAG